MLAALLARRTPAGVYTFADAHGVPDLRHVVEHAGWRFAGVDGWTHPGKAGFLDDVARALELPDWFGHNLDALADSLRDLDGPTLLLWDGWGPLAREQRTDFDGLVDVLRERAGVEPAFTALLLGEGPDVGLPRLG